MSHIVTVPTRVKDPVAVAAACQRLELPAPQEGTATLYSGEARGLCVQLPGWRYPAVIDTASGTILYDNFNGHWGEQKHLDQFLQAYAIEKARLEAQQRGHTVTEQALPEGYVRLEIVERA